MKRRGESPAGIIVRRAVMDESWAIAFVLQEAFIEYKPLYTPAAFDATTPTAEQIRMRWEEGPVWVGVRGGDIVGTVAAVPKTSGLYVRSMAVLPASRGQGVAGKLLGEVENLAVIHRYARMFLSTTPFLDHAIRFYEHFGFQRSDESPRELFGTPLFTMVKPL